jgi:hypothetical protein
MTRDEAIAAWRALAPRQRGRVIGVLWAAADMSEIGAKVGIHTDARRPSHFVIALDLLDALAKEEP